MDLKLARCELLRRPSFLHQRSTAVQARKTADTLNYHRGQITAQGTRSFEDGTERRGIDLHLINPVKRLLLHMYQRFQLGLLLIEVLQLVVQPSNHRLAVLVGARCEHKEEYVTSNGQSSMFSGASVYL